LHHFKINIITAATKINHGCCVHAVILANSRHTGNNRILQLQSLPDNFLFLLSWVGKADVCCCVGNAFAVLIVGVESQCTGKSLFADKAVRWNHGESMI
jgi:hypothetical protein